MTMRIVSIPLDSRPANLQFPKRLAAIAGVELVVPPLEMLGDLHHAADGLALAHWLRDTVMSEVCTAAIFSWDALCYGGLIQSRQLNQINEVKAISRILGEIDWRRTAGYAFATVPRLGISVTSTDKLFTHQTVRDYFIAKGQEELDPKAAAAAADLETVLGKQNVEMIWRWRERNHRLALEAIESSSRLGLQLCHVAVEDNAPSGPHLAEVEALRFKYLRLRRDYPEFRCTFFDGADECNCLLLARAITDARGCDPLPVQLTIHPDTPGAQRYTGRFETHTLEEGLGFLGKFLGLHYHYAPRSLHWLIAHGVQPQPDVFDEAPEKVFNNPFLLPKQLPDGGSLFISDIAACNGANPALLHQLNELQSGVIHGLVGFNTNFNTLGVSAAWLRLAPPKPSPASQRFFIERLADDLVYQSIARPLVVKYLVGQGLDPLDFSRAQPQQFRECEQLANDCWNQWIEETGGGLLQDCGINRELDGKLRYRFPWSRAFEVEVSLDS